MHFVVTGAAGFIGSTLTSILLREGHQVLGVDNLNNYYDPAIKKRRIAAIAASDSFNIMPIDLTGAVEEIDWTLVDAVIHLAGQPGVRPSWTADFSGYLKDNVLATKALLDAIRRSGFAGRLVYASSSSVYGERSHGDILHESDPCRPFSPYGVTKLAAEHLVMAYGANFGLDVVALRYFTVYGPGQRPDMAFSRFISAGLSGRPITVFGDGEQVREFTFVDDIARATRDAAVLKLGDRRVFNVAGGTTATLNDCLAILESEIGQRLAVIYHAVEPGDVRQTSASIHAAQEELHWTPRVSLQEGLSRQVAHARDATGAAAYAAGSARSVAELENASALATHT
jgi:UDP-glucuronate 4-epimerase